MSQNSLASGEVLGRWSLVRKLGKGGNGEVWLGANSEGTEAAIKVLNKMKPIAYTRFKDEVHIMKDNADIPGILPILDYVEMLTYTPQNIALFTDGIQRLALHFASHSVFAPFFIPMFQRLSAKPPGRAVELEPELQTFLNSAKVNERTDDDKTLVLVTRYESITSQPHQ